jgi:uncharacterized protein
MNTGADKKLKKLRCILKDLGSAVIAFSGGVDSTFLAKVARETLKDKAIAVTVATPFLSKEEKNSARTMAKSLDIKHLVRELDLPEEVMLNGPDRCYACKKTIFAYLRGIAEEKGYNAVIEGSNRDDLGDYRPGKVALKELRIHSPLLEAGFTKADIRGFSKMKGLATWDKPSCCCLATRVPYGEEITPSKLRVIDAAESFLKKLGFGQLRFRLHGDIGRIEVPREDLAGLISKSPAIGKKLKTFGVKYICADLEGYRTGSMNEALTWKKRK